MVSKRAVFIPDTHIGVEIDGEPSHDERALQLVIDIIKDIQPDYIYILGDFGEFHATTSHPKHPQIKQLLKDEVYEVIKWLKRVSEAAPDSERHFIEGNHSNRVARYIQSKCPDIFDMVNIDEILKLDELGFKYHRYGPNQLVRVANTSLYARHEPYGRSSEASVRKAACSLIHGHDHKLHRASFESADGREMTSVGAGCLINKSCKIYEYVKTRAQWQLGFVIVDIIDDDLWFPHLIDIKNYQCSFAGVLYGG